jgi:hypothetical protein
MCSAPQLATWFVRDCKLNSMPAYNNNSVQQEAQDLLRRTGRNIIDIPIDPIPIILLRQV